MIYLQEEASNLYFNLTRFSFHTEKISWSHYLDRMLALKSMCDPNDYIFTKANKILLVEEWANDDWPLENDTIYTNSTIESEIESNEKIKPGISRDKNDHYRFLSIKKGLKDWVFHQYDADFHPSIPHGHFQGKNHPKLDAYLGWIYKGSKQIDRLSKKFIIDLWNDEEFRVFARIAIEWYMDENPNFNWRVNRPLMLPRFR